MTWLPLMPIKRTYYERFDLAEKIAKWQKPKALVLDSVSSPITSAVHRIALTRMLFPCSSWKSSQKTCSSRLTS